MADDSDNGFARQVRTDFSFHAEVNDRRFGDVAIYKHKFEKRYVAKRGHMCNTADEYAAYVRSCRTRSNLKHKSILQLLGVQEANEDNICGDFNRITIYFEYYFHDLEKELARRRDNEQEYFSESELWYLLDSLVSACSYLEKSRIYHGDLRPTNILLTSEGLVKIADHGILHIDQSGYAKMLSGRDKCYLTPSLIRSLKAGEFRPYHDQWKTDVYSLGMTLLETATLCPPGCAYDFNRLEIQPANLQALLQSCSTRYSDFFVNLLADMLNDDEQQRPSFDHLKQFLQPFSNSNNSNHTSNSRIAIGNQPSYSKVIQSVSNVSSNMMPSELLSTQQQSFLPNQVHTLQQTSQHQPLIVSAYNPTISQVQVQSSYKPPQQQVQQYSQHTVNLPSQLLFPSLSEHQQVQHMLINNNQSQQQLFQQQQYQLQLQQQMQLQQQQPQQISQQSDQKDPATAAGTEQILNKVNEALSVSQQTVQRHKEQSNRQNGQQTQNTTASTYSIQQPMAFQQPQQQAIQQAQFQQIYPVVSQPQIIRHQQGQFVQQPVGSIMTPNSSVSYQYQHQTPQQIHPITMQAAHQQSQQQHEVQFASGMYPNNSTLQLSSIDHHY